MDQTTFQIILLIIGVGSTVVIAILFKYIFKPEIEKVFEANQLQATKDLAHTCANKFFSLDQILSTSLSPEKFDRMLYGVEVNLGSFNMFQNRTDIYVKRTDSAFLHTTSVLLKGMIQSFRDYPNYDTYNKSVKDALFTLYTDYQKYIHPTYISMLEDFIIYHKLELTKDQYDAICYNYRRV